jgi:hypothetical protein
LLLRESTLALALGGLLWFSFGQDSSAKALAQRTFDVVDSRPSRSILILGNSRTYQNDMPARHVTYAPDNLNKRDAEALRDAVDSFPQLVG